MSNETLFAKTERLQNKYPGATIVLDAKTLRVLARSKNPVVIARKIQSLDKKVVPIFIGGPASPADLAFHHFCLTGK